LLTITIITRFILHPGTFTHSLTNPHEGFFFSTFWLSIATVITNTTAYRIPNSGPWLIAALRFTFWTYTVCATLLAIFYYHILFTVKKLVLTNVLPGWVLPIFPAMLVGALASAIAKTQPAEHALPILVAGLSYQGLGMIVAIMMYALYFGRLLTSGLPADMSCPAMFIAVGPPSFTALAFIGMAQDVTATKIFST
jgi:tellurite resistance protein TehA-like permease